MSTSWLGSHLPSIITYLINFLLEKSTFYGIVIIIIGILMIMFSKYFKPLFFLFYILFMMAILGYYFSLVSKLLIAIFISLLVFMPFLYLAFKNGYSMTVINLFMLGYFLLIFPAIKYYLNSYLLISTFIVVIFISSIITFYMFLLIKRKLFLPEGERI